MSVILFTSCKAEQVLREPKSVEQQISCRDKSVSKSSRRMGVRATLIYGFADSTSTAGTT
jgi:hypothetical protein